MLSINKNKLLKKFRDLKFRIKKAYLKISIAGTIISTPFTAILPLPFVTRIDVDKLESTLQLQEKIIIYPYFMGDLLQQHVHFSEQENKIIFNLAVQHYKGNIDKKQVLEKLATLKGENSDWSDYVIGLALVAGTIYLVNKLYSPSTTQALANDGRKIVPPHLQWLYGPNPDLNNFGYGNSNRQTRGKYLSATNKGNQQIRGSEKKIPIPGEYDYCKIMKQLDSKSGKKNVIVQVAGKSYCISNPYNSMAEELSDKMAEKMYDSIRKSTDDIDTITKNLGYKRGHIEKIKAHVFTDTHILDMYPGKEEIKRFDPDLQQAMAWSRLENNTFLEEDRTWLKHEFAEHNYETKFQTGYSKSHSYAESKYAGRPWNDNWKD